MLSVDSDYVCNEVYLGNVADVANAFRIEAAVFGGVKRPVIRPSSKNSISQMTIVSSQVEVVCALDEKLYPETGNSISTYNKLYHNIVFVL